MATSNQPLDYYRRYLDDPLAVGPQGTPQANPEQEPPDPNISYFRRYLVDPIVVGGN